MLLNFFLLIIGFYVLVKSADFLIDGSTALAKRLNIPTIVIGLTIVASGTSAPELSVNIIASLAKSNEIALGNVIGSNIANILLIAGISAVFTPLLVKPNTTWIEIPFCFLSALVTLILANDKIIDALSFSYISRSDGIILLLFFTIFLVYNFFIGLKNECDKNLIVKEYTILKSIIIIILSLCFLFGSGWLIVYSAKKIALSLGISERVIGLTIVAIGTSLPELITSLVALHKKEIDLALGNVIGSNIFNVFFILGISSVIYPINIAGTNNIDLLLNILASLLLFIFVFTGKVRKIDRTEGIIFLVIYFSYVIFLFYKK
ncbi:MAG TPA: calcium/sodium antiporter [bacterium]|nr:calcium/sodium antiporter [bacterium]HOL47361.1 calcium/sodium antiporter [bacterium]HPQ18906.1 calcium/sodium antiporter [bacterium]